MHVQITPTTNLSTISELPQSNLQIVINRPSISGSPSNHQEELQLVSSNPSRKRKSKSVQLDKNFPCGKQQHASIIKLERINNENKGSA
jgi:hypothetical protein